MSGSRVLASDYLAVNNNLLAPSLGRLVPLGADSLETVLKQEGHSLGEARLGFLLVGEASDLAALDQRLAVNLDVGKHNGAVTHGGHGLAGLVELFDQRDRVLVVDEVVHGAVAAGVEDGGELARAADKVFEGGSRFPQLLAEEFLGRFVVLEGLDGARVEGCYPALGGCQDKLGLGGKDIVGVSKFGL